MRTRYFLIEPKYSDPDTFCSFIVGSDRMRASINIYADEHMLRNVAYALVDPSLTAEMPDLDLDVDESLDSCFDIHLSVRPEENGSRALRIYIIQDMLDDNAPFRADVRMKLSRDEAVDFSVDLVNWCNRMDYTFIWTAG